MNTTQIPEYLSEDELIKMDACELKNHISKLQAIIQELEHGAHPSEHKKIQLPPKMTLIGFLGFKEEGDEVYLYQCPKCKNVAINHMGDTFCDCFEVKT